MSGALGLVAATPLIQHTAFLCEGGGCDAVALCCTEIPLLVTPEVSPLPTLDSTRLLARAAVEVARGDFPPPSWACGPMGRS